MMELTVQMELYVKKVQALLEYVLQVCHLFFPDLLGLAVRVPMGCGKPGKIMEFEKKR